jgi:serine/threonine protein phosphatase 1
MPIAIGDIHGCLEPLQRLVRRLPPSEPLVFLGDYIDRGPQSAGVVAYLLSLRKAGRPCRFLMGNHEQMLLKSLVQTEAISLWLYNGGTPTLISYGTHPRTWMHAPQRQDFLGSHHAFYQGLELYVEDEDTIYVHAGIDLGIADMRLQDPDVLLWIRDKFYHHATAWHGKQVIFGHTPTRSMGLSGKAIFQEGNFYGIDTGCVYGGYLTAIDSRTHELWQEPSTFPPSPLHE